MLPRSVDIFSTTPNWPAEFACLCGLFLGLVLLISGCLKLWHWRRFRDTLRAMEMVPPALLDAVLWCVVAAELCLCVCLLSATATNVSGLLVILLLAAFTLTLCCYRLRGNKELVCGCFADFQRKSSVVFLIVRNLVLTLLALPLLVVEESAFPTWQPLQWFLAGLTLTGVWLTWRAFAQVVEVFALQRQEFALQKQEMVADI